jgi:hypothetical protein
MSYRWLAAAMVVGASAACGANAVEDQTTTAADTTDCTASADGLFDDLRCTGLYSDFATKTVAPDVNAFTPGFELWSDGAEKSRFIYLPPGTQIDATDMNSWVFPVGTKLWKEFRVALDADGGQPGEPPVRVETRMMHKAAEGKWLATTYVWSGDEAKRVKTGIFPFPGTKSYEVPAERTCNRCHSGRKDHVLGFEAVLTAAPEATGLTYDQLVARGLLKNAALASSSLQIPGNSVERDAIGRLHANCGISCHHPDGPGPFSMRLDAELPGLPTAIEDTSVFKEAINQESGFTPANGTGTYYRIRPTDTDGSTIFYRMSKRDAPAGFEQMPPVATHKPSPELIASMKSWIDSMTAAPYPAPLPR